ncbi:trypsin-like peptidase domain-containing protein [Streptomyces marokkonensis]|uniref:VMAP-C domain-containing protein n=1 Tax=Streptomyces marokkonensis TaxID=324855 RepID=UPI0011F1A3BC|nr:trypsin-like peptidase domain-containing protein [Streptomyces marokkonensis]
MSRAAWHTRIECGNDVGAGFLVSARQVVTCAHVVAASDTSAVSVSFPNHAALGQVSAAVSVHGGWRGGGTDPGDLAVLELEREVPLTPAVFAPPGAERDIPLPVLSAYGFPRGYDEGALAQYRAVPGPLIADEWVQVEAFSGHGQPLADGFSGAAMTLADGSVVGMVTAVAGGRDVRAGRMLPTEVMARYWSGLSELVPTPGHTRDQLRELYDLVRRAEREGVTCDHDRLYVDAVGAFGPSLPEGGFGSLASAAAYVQWEVSEAVPRFAARLRGLLDHPGCRSEPAPDVRPGHVTAWSPIVVEIDHSGVGPDQVTVEVSAYHDGQRRPVGTRRLPRSGVRAYVQEHIDEAVTQLAPGADELLAFVLPRGWLNEPVARWECGADDPTPLGCAYPLVVADRTRHRSGRLRHQLHKKWQKLEKGATASLHRIECGTPERPPTLRKRLWDDGTGLVGFASPPDAAREHFEVGLTVPVPVLLWPRAGCREAGHEGPCDGGAFLDELTASVAGVPPADLPHHVLSLRLTADADDEADRHWARDVQLLWDDPRCFPETAAPLHSPVA